MSYSQEICAWYRWTDVPEAKETFEAWIEPMLEAMHYKGYQASAIRRAYIPRPGKQEKRPLGVPCVADRALQRSTAQVLSAICEQDFFPCSFGGRPGVGAHHGLATLTEVIAGGKVGLGCRNFNSYPKSHSSINQASSQRMVREITRFTDL